MVKNIAVIRGDGIGPEVIAEGVRVLEHVAKLDGGFKFEFTHFPWIWVVALLISTAIRFPSTSLKSAWNPIAFSWELSEETSGTTFPDTCAPKKDFFVFVREWVFTPTTAPQKFGHSSQMLLL